MVSEVKETPTLSKRAEKEKEELLSAIPRVDVERMKFLLEVYQETEGQPAVIRRAKVFHRLCSEKSIHIDSNPIVGTLTKYKYGSYPLPEIGCRWMKKLDMFRLALGFASVTEEEKEWIDKAAEYFKNANIFNRTQEIMLQSRGVDIGFLQKCGIGTEFTPGGLMDSAPDYSEVLSKGLKGIIAEIEEEKAKLDIGSPEDINKWYFYEAVSLCLNGLIKLAQRYASLAKETALKEANSERKRELKEIAEICEWVPANPARGFREALQSVWFITMGIWFENPTTGNPTPGRFTQYMYPFYKKDREKGRLTDEEAIELIQFFFLRLQGLSQVLPPFGFKYSQSRSALNLSIGGLTPDGEDATNELDWLVLEAKRRIMIPEPLLCLLYHDRLAEDFLLKCVELIRTGIGQPSFVYIEKCIQHNLYLHKGITVEEARNNAVVPCTQTIIPGYSDQFWEGHLNTAKMLELALNNGKDPLTEIQIGPQTGRAESFETYEQLHQAVVEQLRYFIPLARNSGRIAWNMAKDFPVPFASAFTHDCIKKGKDMSDGGGRYSAGIGLHFISVVDLGNSLAAIKKLVFEDKKVTIKELLKALAADFEGYEEVQRLCLEAPKYGNGDRYADSIVEKLYRACGEEVQRLPDFLGRPLLPHAVSVSAHGGMGEITGALPSGRKARVALTDASVSASPGTDRNGPTALVESAARAIDTTKFGSNHFNMKFHPSALKGSENARKFLSLIKTYMDLGGYHVQFNCVSSKTLRDAQLHPEKYRNLIVRVAGFSAYFVTLDPVVQEEMIKRTELSFA